MKVVWSRPAREHLDEIATSIQKDDPVAAGKVVNRVLDRVEELAAHPHLGRAGRRDGTRELVISSTPFIAIYRVREGQVDVLAVFHGSRRWPDLP